MADKTDNHEIPRIERYDQTNWDIEYDSFIDIVEQRLTVYDAESELSQYEPYAGVRFIGSDTGAWYIGTGSAWTRLDPVFGSVDIRGDLVSGGTTIYSQSNGLNASLLDDESLAYVDEAETISGSWNYTTRPTFGGSPLLAQSDNFDADTLDGYEAAALAALAENETVTGTWTFNSALTANSILLTEDPGFELDPAADAEAHGLSTGNADEAGFNLQFFDDDLNSIRINWARDFANEIALDIYDPGNSTDLFQVTDAGNAIVPNGYLEVAGGDLDVTGGNIDVGVGGDFAADIDVSSGADDEQFAFDILDVALGAPSIRWRRNGSLGLAFQVQDQGNSTDLLTVNDDGTVNAPSGTLQEGGTAVALSTDSMSIQTEDGIQGGNASLSFGDSMTLRVSERYTYNPGHTEWPDQLSSEEVARYQAGTGEGFTIEEMQFSQKGGGTSNTSVTLDVYDVDAASVVASVNLNDMDSQDHTVPDGNDIIVRISNSSGGTIEATPVVDLYKK